MQHAPFALVRGRAPREMCIARREAARLVLGMNPERGAPFIDRLRLRPRRQPGELAAARRGEDLAGGEVIVPDAVVGAGDREGVALLHGRERRLRLVEARELPVQEPDEERRQVGGAAQGGGGGGAPPARAGPPPGAPPPPASARAPWSRPARRSPPRDS